jgi:hypothetical protein
MLTTASTISLIAAFKDKANPLFCIYIGFVQRDFSFIYSYDYL